MGLFNWKKQEKGPAEHPYYGAYVKVDGDLIRFNNDHDEKREMRFEEVSRISIVSYVEENPQEDYWVYFWPFSGGGNLSIPSKAGGFQALTDALKNLPGFDVERYKHVVNRAGKKHTLVYEKEETPCTAQLLPVKDSTAFGKIAAGIWLERQQKWIPWGSFAELEQLNIFRKSKVFAPNTDYYYYQYLLEDVSIFGGLKLKALTTTTPVEGNERKLNAQWPVTQFYAGIILGKSGRETFTKLCEHFTMLWKAPDKKTECVAKWRQGRVTVGLVIYKNNELGGYHSECSLTIFHEPDLRAFYTNDYQQDLRLDAAIHYKAFPIAFKIPKDYTVFYNAFYTPECFKELLNEETGGLVWVDKNTGRMGFAHAVYCRIFEWKDVQEFILVAEYWRDELNGYQLWYRETKTRRQRRLLSFSPPAHFSMEAFLSGLKALTGLECMQREDRQYY